jgi:type VI protein secretion system component VasK
MSDDMERDRFLFDLINQRQTQEFQRSTDIDTKANNLLVFDTAIVGFLLGVANVVRSFIIKQPLFQIGIFVLGVALLFAAVFFVFVAQRVRRWSIVPNVEMLVQKYSVKPLQETIETVGGEMAKNVKELEKHINSKASALEIGWYMTLAGMFVILIYTGISLSH